MNSKQCPKMALGRSHAKDNNGIMADHGGYNMYTYPLTIL
jgi:hypothetical protein